MFHELSSEVSYTPGSISTLSASIMKTGRALDDLVKQLQHGHSSPLMHDHQLALSLGMGLLVEEHSLLHAIGVTFT